MQNQIRILYPQIRPAINRCMGKFPRTRPDQLCTTPGFMVEILVTITDELGLEIVPSTVDLDDAKDSKHIGAVVGNHSSGLLSYVVEGRVDTLAIPFHDYGASRELFDLSSPIFNTTASFFYRKQLHRGNNWFEFFKVYNKTVWMALGLLLLVVIIFLHVAKCFEIRLDHKCRPNLKQRAKHHCQIAWYALQFMLGHAQYGKFKSSAVNFGLLALSCCYGIVILGIYGSWILSLKLNPVVMQPIRNIDRLSRMIKNHEFHMVAKPSKALSFSLLTKANLTILQKISDALEHNPIHLVDNDSVILEHLTNDRSVAYAEADEQLYLELQRKCGIVELSEHLSNIPAVFVFQKGSPYLEPFNNVIRRRRELFQKIIFRYLGLDRDEVNTGLCGRDKEAERLPYFGLCASLGGMGVLGIVVLIFEKIVFYLCRSKNSTIDSSDYFPTNFLFENKPCRRQMFNVLKKKLSSRKRSSF